MKGRFLSIYKGRRPFLGDRGSLLCWFGERSKEKIIEFLEIFNKLVDIQYYTMYSIAMNDAIRCIILHTNITSGISKLTQRGNNSKSVKLERRKT